MSTVTVREAAIADLPHIQRLWSVAQEVQAGLRPFRATRNPDDEFRDTVVQTMGADGHTWLLAESNGQVVGMAYLHEEEPSRVSDEKALELSRVSVDPSARGRGIGTQLVDEAERIARERGIRFLSAKIFSQNTGALAFWDTLGFAPYFEQRLRRLD